MLLCYEARYGVLGDVSVLEFVYHEVDVAVLVLGCHVVALAQQEIGLEQQVVEVNGVGASHEGLIPLIDATNNLVEVARGAHPKAFGGEKLALCAGDGGKDCARGELLGVNFQFAHAALDHVQLIGVVVYAEVAVQTYCLAILSQRAGAEGVERAHGESGRLVGSNILYPGSHLAGGFVGEGNGGDPSGRHANDIQEIGYPRGYQPGLSAARTSDDQKRPVNGFDCFALSFVQVSKDIRSHKRAPTLA